MRLANTKIGRIILVIALVIVLVRAALWVRNLLQLSNVSGEQDTTKIDKSRGVLRGIIEAVRQRSKPKETP
jgi:hypothetical protein